MAAVASRSHVPRNCTTWRSSTTVMRSARSPQVGQRRTTPAPRKSRWAPTGLCPPQVPQPRSTMVISRPTISPSSPAIALPSSQVASVSTLISSSRRSEALGADRARVVAGRDEQVGGALDERGRPAHEDARPVLRARPDRLDHRGIDAPAEAGPAGRLLARQGEAQLHAGQVLELVAVEHVLDAPC